MKRILGILVLFAVVYLATWIMADLMTGRQSFLSGFNQENLLRRTALFGILGIGVAFVIITGGIDLSIGSMVCLVGVGVPWCVTELNWPVWLTLAAALALSVGIGFFHGTLITKLRLPPFIVTLCGLLMYAASHAASPMTRRRASAPATRGCGCSRRARSRCLFSTTSASRSRFCS